MSDSKLKIAVPAKVDQALGRLALHGEDGPSWESDEARVDAFIRDLRAMADKAEAVLDAALPVRASDEPEPPVDGE